VLDALDKILKYVTPLKKQGPCKLEDEKRAVILQSSSERDSEISEQREVAAREAAKEAPSKRPGPKPMVPVSSAPCCSDDSSPYEIQPQEKEDRSQGQKTGQGLL